VAKKTATTDRPYMRGQQPESTRPTYHPFDVLSMVTSAGMVTSFYAMAFWTLSMWISWIPMLSSSLS
jgi:hypothetical protein